ncbi:hypothetical protein KFL_001000140 [Klebsormidium nitens]|uniref:RWD domain-containing protein n=1 Tax=Klebsormidium nitens TaxID=105231 RepID=A0A1Y1HWC2_KLENI|nr:hypothetical protein KFL_001000140 [Klebsormidium nitens]|eukprot:GAQ82092.1 hypothetical protein KFL_001000140 [Klebsormidium nitens]
MGSQKPFEDVVLECIQRQLAELEALQSMYPGDGEFVMAKPDAEAVSILKELAESASNNNRLIASVPDASLPEISFTINLLDTCLGGQPLSIHFQLPRQYPQLAAPSIRVDCSGLVTRGQHQEISSALQQLAGELVGQESILDLLQKAQEIVADLKEDVAQESASSSEPTLEGPRDAVILRRALWFHHLKALSKRKAICEWSKELRLGGYCKPGFPGVLIFEGQEEDVHEYQQRLQHLRWQALQQRGQESEQGKDIECIRRFPIGIKELPEGGMSELASYCRSANLESLFLTALKIER